MMGAEQQKFKVGDKVRLTEQYGRHPIGTEGIVSDVVGGGDDDDLIYTDTVSGVYARRLELVPTWQPKVGDRVVSNGESTHGEVGTVVDGAGHYSALTMVKFDTWRNGHDGVNLYGNNGKEHWLVQTDDLQPAPTLTIEAGKFYKTRDGRKVGPMITWPDINDNHFTDRLCEVHGDGRYWKLDGKGFGADDLIAEWVVDIVWDKDDLSKGQWDGGYYPDCFELASAPSLATPTAIVALIEDGVAKPATRPVVHTTEEAAKREADRLACIHKGQQFGVYVLTTTSQEAKPIYEHEWQRLAAKGEKINAIKELRSITGMGLKPAKDVVEGFIYYPYGAAA